MKRYFISVRLLVFCSLAMLLFGFSMCGKKDDDSEKTVKERIVGKWTLAKLGYKETGVAYYEEPAEPGDYFEFRNDNTLVLQIDGEVASTTWQLVDDNHIQLYDNNSQDIDVPDEPFEINTLTDNSLVLYVKETNVDMDDEETTVFLTR